VNTSVLHELDATCRGTTRRQLGSLVGDIDKDMTLIEESLQVIEGGAGPASRCVRHLLGSRGKRLRPLCTALAARCGPLGFTKSARKLAVAAELVHSATLLHDDVVDVGDERRGQPTARVVYGNAASIFGGDWMLVEAMRFIRQADVPDVLDEALVVLQQMVEAESLQLAMRGRTGAGVEQYMRVAEGKTAVLFGWALSAGARAGGADASTTQSLGEFGRKLGLAFQVVDDMLDLEGSAEHIGKTALADVREGKLTYPIVVAAERSGDVRRWLGEVSQSAHVEQAFVSQLAAAILATGAGDTARAFAERVTSEALSALDRVPACSAKAALHQAANMMLRRSA